MIHRHPMDSNDPQELRAEAEAIRAWLYDDDPPINRSCGEEDAAGDLMDALLRKAERLENKGGE